MIFFVCNGIPKPHMHLCLLLYGTRLICNGSCHTISSSNIACNACLHYVQTAIYLLFCTHSLPPSLPPSLARFLTHSLPPSLTHSLTPSLPPSLTHSLTHPLTHSLTHQTCPSICSNNMCLPHGSGKYSLWSSLSEALLSASTMTHVGNAASDRISFTATFAILTSKPFSLTQHNRRSLHC